MPGDEASGEASPPAGGTPRPSIPPPGAASARPLPPVSTPGAAAGASVRSVPPDTGAGGAGTSNPATTPASPAPVARLASLDTFRGLVLLLLTIEAPNWGWARPLAEKFQGSPFWEGLAQHTSHVHWQGCNVWDLIQPAFMFMVGVSMAYSYAKRESLGQGWFRMFGHVVFRAAVLILLGVLLRSEGRAMTNWTFEDVLTQIGLGYVFLFLLWNRPAWLQAGAAVGILAAYWAWFAFSPLPGPDFDWDGHGAEAVYATDSFFAHWNKNANPAHFADRWFLNLFPREEPFAYNGGGYNTLNFVPSLAVMVIGLMAGELLRSGRAGWTKALTLILAGAALAGAGWALDHFGACPLVKRSWTSAFSLYSAGWCLAALGLLFTVIDLWRLRGWNYPLVVLGANSIAVYIMIHPLRDWLDQTLTTHFGEDYAGWFGNAWTPVVQNLCIAAIIWLICLWLYRRRVFIRI